MVIDHRYNYTGVKGLRRLQLHRRWVSGGYLLMQHLPLLKSFMSLLSQFREFGKFGNSVDVFL